VDRASDGTPDGATPSTPSGDGGTPGADLPRITLVDDAAGARTALADLDLPVVGVDVERADGDRYFRHAALVQVGAAGTCVLLDGMVLDDMAALQEHLATRLTVLHAASNDVVPLASKGVAPPQLVDTAVAAAVLGLPMGLGALLGEVLGLTLGGDKESFQRADWSKRPIPADMQEYAAGDVVHLPALWQVLADRLDLSGRTAWFEQELVANLENAVTDTRDWRRVRGVGRLGPRQQTIARALWEAREALARSEDIAPNLLLHDEVIVALATEPPRTAAQLARRARRRRRMEPEHAERFLAVVVAAEATDPPPPDPDRRRWTDRDTRAFDRLREARSKVAVGLGIDAGVLCASKPLKDAVRTDPTDAEALSAAAGLRPWQHELLGDVLWRAYRGSGSSSSSDAPDLPEPAELAESSEPSRGNS
jgi:ribonuclease D